MNAKPAVLEISELEIGLRAKSKTLTHGINLQVHSGQLMALVGESGSGKSLTAFASSGLLAPALSIYHGQIIFRYQNQEYDLTQLDPTSFRKLQGKAIGFIFQEPMTALNPSISCGEQVAEQLRQHTDWDESLIYNEVMLLFKQVQLPRAKQLYHAYPHQLSGGQKQRVVIAMAIACKPQLLIADEPTTALDVTVQAEILRLISELQQKRQMAVLFITHDLGVVKHIADQITVLYHGRVVEQGTAQMVLGNPRHPYTQGLLACRPLLYQPVKWLPTVKEFLEKGINSAKRSYKKNEAKSSKTQEKPLLEVRHLTKWFGNNSWWKGDKRVIAVDDVSFKIYPGETMGLVGESGCGKTSLSRSLLLLDPPNIGQIFFNGQDITTLDKRALRKLRSKIQIIFQDPYASLNPRLSVGETLMEVLKMHRKLRTNEALKTEGLRLLEKVDLSAESWHKYPHEFSGGQRQRIGIARTLAVAPQFIICDESVSALDVSVQAQVLNLLNELKDEFGFTYLFISHDLSVVRHMADRLLVMKNGKIIESGDAKDLYENPQTEYTQKLINAVLD